MYFMPETVAYDGSRLAQWGAIYFVYLNATVITGYWISSYYS